MRFLSVLLVFSILTAGGAAHNHGWVGTLPTSLFTSVLDMKPHPTLNNTLIIADNPKFFSLNLENGTKTLIAGSDRGYKEGKGSEAKFYWPNSFLVLDATQILVSDSINDCLRFLSLVTEITHPYAGTCEQAGFADGLYGKLDSPSGLVLYQNRIFVLDTFNNAIQEVLQDDGSLRTVAVGGDLIRPNHVSVTEGLNKLIVTVMKGIVLIDPDTGKIEMIGGMNSASGHIDGDLSSSLFSHMMGLVSVAPGLLFIADGSKARLVDLSANWVSTICAGDFENREGYDVDCGFQSAWCVTSYNGVVYIGDMYAGVIRTISQSFLIDSRPLTNSVWLEVEYNFASDRMTATGNTVASMVLIQHHKDLLHLCPDCNLIESKDHPNFITTEAGNFGIRWKTSLVSPTQALGSDMMRYLDESIMRVQNAFLSLTARFLDVTIINANPQIVSPIAGRDGLYLRPVVVPECLGGLRYSPSTGRCSQ